MRILFLLLTVSSFNQAFATNGANLLGASAASLGLGGTGVSHFTNGTDAIYKNPAVLSELTDPVGSIALEFHTSILKLNGTGSYNDTLALSAVQARSDVPNQTTARVIPNIVGTYRLNEQVALGLGIVGQAGSTSNYPDEAQIAKPMSDVTYARIMPTVSYKPAPWFAVGVSPFIGYGEFALNESSSTASSLLVQSTRAPHGSVAVGLHTGVQFTADKFSFGGTWTTKTGYSFKDLSDVEAFLGAADGLETIEIQQPEEFALGITYRTTPELTFTFDYRLIMWGSAKGYQTFGWNNQNVFALGAQYRLNALALRLGFNYANSPYDSNEAESGAGTNDLQGHVITNKTISDLNIFAFPAVFKSHLTVGAGYRFGEQFDLDGAFVYGFANTITRSGTFAGPSTYTFSTRMSMWSLTLGGRYRF